MGSKGSIGKTVVELLLDLLPALPDFIIFCFLIGAVFVVELDLPVKGL